MYIGNKKVVITETLMVPDGEIAKLSTKLDDDDELNLELEFIENEEENEEEKEGDKKGEGENSSNSLSIDFKDNIFKFTFKNFRDSFGTNNTNPIHFGNSNTGQPLTILTVIRRLSGLTKIELQVMLEVENG